MAIDNLMRAAETAAKALSGKDVTGFEVYVKGASSTTVEVKEQALDAFEQAKTWGIGIRVLAAGGRLGFAYSTGSSDAAEAAAAMAVVNAKNAEPDEHNVLPAPPGSPYPDASEHDPRIHELDEPEKIHRAKTLEKAALGYDPRVKRVRKSSATFTETEWAIISSSGIKASCTGTHFSCGLMVAAEDGGDSQMGYDFDYKRTADGIDFEAVGISAAKKAVGLLGARKAESGRFPVVLDNVVASQFLGVLSASFSAEALIKGKSMLDGRLGRAVCSKHISIYDDALMPGGAGTRPFDDEGAPSMRTPLIVDGVLKGFLHNAYSAKRLGEKTTGNAVRGGFRTQPGVGSTNLYIEKGHITKDELLSEVKKGILVQEVLGMHTANAISGEFSVGIAGYFIQDGKIAYPVREAAIADNILSVFAGVDEVASDLRFSGRLGAPTILLRPVSVSSA